MSVLTGTLAGALVATGVYYAFSDMIRQRTELHSRELHLLSHRMRDSPPVSMDHPTAASRITRSDTFTDLLKERWNAQLQVVFNKTGEFEERIKDWGDRNLLQKTQPTEK